MLLLSAPSLCPIVQGVVFEFSAFGRRTKAVVLAEALEECLGASADKATWLPCFQRHHDRLLDLALKRCEAHEDLKVVMIRARDLQDGSDAFGKPMPPRRGRGVAQAAG